MAIDVAVIADVPLFAGLADADRGRIAERMHDVEVPEGEHLVEEGDLSYKFYVILEGKAEVIRDGVVVADVGPGDFVGESGILEHARRNAAVVAVSPVRAAVLIGWDLRELMDEYPSVRGHIVRTEKERSEPSS